MTPDEMERAIYETFIENYDATPALHLTFRLNAKRATRRIQAEMRAERITAERTRREHVRELAKLPLRERIAQIRTHVPDEVAG